MLKLKETIPAEIQSALSSLADTAQRESNLHAVYIYGGLARGRWRGIQSDTNILAILKSTTMEDLVAIEKIWPVVLRIDPMYLHEQEVADFARKFPAKCFDIQRRHILLCGDDALASIKISSEVLFERAAQEVLNLLMRLRRRVGPSHTNDSMMFRILSENVRPFAVQLLVLLHAKSIECVDDSTQAIFAKAAEKFQLSNEVLKALSNLRNHPQDNPGALQNLYARFLSELEKLRVTLAI